MSCKVNVETIYEQEADAKFTIDVDDLKNILGTERSLCAEYRIESVKQKVSRVKPSGSVEITKRSKDEKRESDNETEDNFAVSYRKKRRMEANNPHNSEPRPGPSRYSPASPVFIPSRSPPRPPLSPRYLPSSSDSDLEDDDIPINIRMPDMTMSLSPSRSFGRYRTREEYNYSPPIYNGANHQFDPYSPASPTYSPASPSYSPASPSYSPASPTYSRGSGYRNGDPNYSPTRPSLIPFESPSPPFRINSEHRPFDPRRRF